DVDEQLVHERGDVRVLEGLVGHDVAPVPGRVADRQQDRLVLGPGPREGPRPPRVPVDRVVGVAAEGGAGLAGGPVHAPTRGAPPPGAEPLAQGRGAAVTSEVIATGPGAAGPSRP